LDDNAFAKSAFA
jgi:hypothetical protein